MLGLLVAGALESAPTSCAALGSMARLSLGSTKTGLPADPTFSQGMSDRDAWASAGARVSYREGPIQGTVGIAHGLNDRTGLLAAARLDFTRLMSTRLIATTNSTAMFADAPQMRREFGVSVAEAIRRKAIIAAGDPRLRPDEANAYRLEGGLSYIGGSVTLNYLVSPHWAVMGLGGVNWLANKAAESPLVRQRTQFWGGIALVWRL